ARRLKVEIARCSDEGGVCDLGGGTDRALRRAVELDEGGSGVVPVVVVGLDDRAFVVGGLVGRDQDVVSDHGSSGAAANQCLTAAPCQNDRVVVDLGVVDGPVAAVAAVDVRAFGAGIAAVEEVVGEHVVVGGVAGVVAHLELLVVAVGNVVMYVVVVGVVDLEGGGVGGRPSLGERGARR